MHAGEVELADFENGDHARTVPVFVENGQNADVVLVHRGERFDDWRVRQDIDQIAAHDVADFWGNVGNEAWRFDAESFQNEINAVVGIAATSSDGVGQAGAAFEFG